MAPVNTRQVVETVGARLASSVIRGRFVRVEPLSNYTAAYSNRREGRSIFLFIFSGKGGMIKRKGARCLIGFESVGKYYLGEQELLLGGWREWSPGRRESAIFPLDARLILREALLTAEER